VKFIENYFFLILRIFEINYFQKKKKKNISMDAFGNRLGRIHMEKQDLSKLQVRKMKGLKRRNDPVVDGSEENSDAKKVKNTDDVINGSADE
jgi:hypothetical protein